MLLRLWKIKKLARENPRKVCNLMGNWWEETGKSFWVLAKQKLGRTLSVFGPRGGFLPMSGVDSHQQLGSQLLDVTPMLMCLNSQFPAYWRCFGRGWIQVEVEIQGFVMTKEPCPDPCLDNSAAMTGYRQDPAGYRPLTQKDVLHPQHCPSFWEETTRYPTYGKEPIRS